MRAPSRNTARPPQCYAGTGTSSSPCQHLMTDDKPPVFTTQSRSEQARNHGNETDDQEHSYRTMVISQPSYNARKMFRNDWTAPLQAVSEPDRSDITIFL
nr:hypothetical protein CFP56_04156 [Quercus suber]